MLPSDTNIKWEVTPYGVYYEDSGTQRIRLEHKLTAEIWATDTVMFELAFRPSSLADPTDTATIGEDYVQCEMSQSSSDAAFWTAKVAEGYYICKPTTPPDATNVCWNIYQDEDSNYTQTTESTSDWVTPFADEDDPDDLWCTKANTTVGDALIDYECSVLRCFIERDLDTGDTTRDLAFTAASVNDDSGSGSTETMVIQPGRAKVYINKTTAQFAYAATNAVEKVIVVPAAASYLASATAFATFALALILF